MSDWSCEVLQAGALRLDGGGMFGIIPKAMWSTWSHPDESNRIPLQTNCLLLRSSAGTVLVETGCGDKWTDRERAMYGLEDRTIVDALREVDITPDEVDLVVVTHLHFDHAGGLTTFDADDPDPSKPALPVFRNAEVVVQRLEWNDAVANRSTMTRTYLRSHLDPIDDRLRLVEGGEEVLPGLRVEPVPGHTRGQQGVLVETTSGTIAFLGDLLPTRHHVHHSAATAYDMDPYETMTVKRALLERAFRERWALALDHDFEVPLVQVDRDARGRYELTNRDS